MNPYRDSIGLSEHAVFTGLTALPLMRKHLLTPKNVCLWKR